jgi:predicted nucleic-acid-binding Zn-ribbon protein
MDFKFRCPKCGGIMFGLTHIINSLSITQPMSMFLDATRLRWTTDSVKEEYWAFCKSCPKGWMATSINRLTNIMIEAGVLT